ncbi:MAG: hypothetical protein AABX59_03030 [Nanoarchaeota archaeon]
MIQVQFPFFDFRSLLSIWESVGLFDIVLPFILIFTLVFAILERSGILGRNRGVYAVVSIAIAFFAINNPFLGFILKELFANAAIGLIVVLIGLLFIGFFVLREEEGWWRVLGAIFALGVLYWVFSRTARATGFDFEFSSLLITNPLFASIILLGIPIAILVAIVVMFSPGREGDTLLEKLTRRRG